VNWRRKPKLKHIITMTGSGEQLILRGDIETERLAAILYAFRPDIEFWERIQAQVKQRVEEGQ
jgi:hypothetical protein